EPRHHVPVQTPHVHVDAVRVRPRRVERMNPADPAEPVPGYLRVERVGRERLLPAQQGEPLLGHDQMQKPLLRADGAVALDRFELVHQHPEPNRAAVTTTLVGKKLHRHAHRKYRSPESHSIVTITPEIRRATSAAACTFAPELGPTRRPSSRPSR